MIFTIDPAVYEMLGPKWITALLSWPLAVFAFVMMFFMPASAIPLYLLMLASVAGIVWLGMRNFDDWYYATGEGPE